MPKIVVESLFELQETSAIYQSGMRQTYQVEAPISDYRVFQWICIHKVNHGTKYSPDFGHVAIDTYTGYAIGNFTIPAPKQLIDLWNYFQFKHEGNGLYVAQRKGVKQRIQSNKLYRVVGYRDGVKFDTGPILAQKTPHQEAIKEIN